MMENILPRQRRHQRKTELSLANVVMCLLVIFIHVSSEPVALLLKDSWEYVTVAAAARLAGFAVPGFIFLSGLKTFLHYGDAMAYPAFYKRRFFAVIVPYIIWFCIYLLYFYLHHEVVMDIGAVVKSFFLGTLVSPFYFVVVIAEFYLLLPLWRRWLQKANPLWALVVAFSLMMVSKSLPQLVAAIAPALPLPPQNVLFTSFLFFWVGGCLAGKYYESFFSLLRRYSKMMLFSLPVVAGVDVALWLSAADGSIPGFWQNLFRMSYCALAIAALLAAAKTYGSRRFFTGDFFKRLDRSAYQIFLSHSLVIFSVNRLLDHYGVADLGLRYLLRAAAVYTVTVALCVAWQWTKERLLPPSVKK